MSGLTVFGLHRFFLLVRAMFPPAPHLLQKQTNRSPEPVICLPTVTVQLPVYNEKHVVKRLIDAVCHLDYDIEKLDIQVLDDSTDDTKAFVDDAVHFWRNKGYPINVIRRSGREGFKAGALAAGLQCSSAQFVVIFDADFIPAPEFLKAALPEFTHDNIGMVQALSLIHI